MKKFYIFILLIIIYFPKISIIDIPGTYIGIRIEDILIAIFIIIYLLKIKNNFRIESKQLKSVFYLFFIYLFFCITSTIIGILYENVTAGLGLMYCLRKLEYFLFVFVGYNFVKEKKDINSIIKIIDLSLIIHILIIVLQKLGVIGAFANGEYIESIKNGRLYSTFNGPYEFAAYLLLLLPMYINEFVKIQKKSIKVIVPIIKILLILIGIYASESRVSFVIAIIVLIGMPLILNKKNFKKMIRIYLLTILIISIIVAILLTVFSKNIFESIKFERFETLNFSSMLKTTQRAWGKKDFDRYVEEGYYLIIADNADMSYAIRINKWMALIDGTLRNPILGLGASITKEAADGNYIRILAETGIVGLICWFFLVRKIIKNSKDYNDSTNLIIKYGMYMLLLTAILIDIFESSKIMMFYWFVLGCAYSNNKLLDKGENDEKDTSSNVDLQWTKIFKRAN